MRNLFILALVGILFSSCATYTPITDKIINDNGWKEGDLKKIQFYTSHQIVLYRQVVNEGNTTITHGEIKTINGREVEQITIKARTPGVLVQLSDGRFAITFEPGDTYYLMFGAVQTKGGRYYLLASDWSDDVGQVTYGGEMYKTDASSAMCLLLVNMKKINKMNVKARTVKGRKVD